VSMSIHRTFADARSTYGEARFVIFGVPYDRTTSYRPGTRFAPAAIREASHSLESTVPFAGVDLAEVPIHDMGDIGEFGPPAEMVGAVEFTLSKIFGDGKFPVALGGEHTLTCGALRALREMDAALVFVDAHMDFRDEYLGEKLSHACVARRALEVLGLSKVVSIGVRSWSAEEVKAARDLGFRFYTSMDVRRRGIGDVLREILKALPPRVYLSIDMDGLDPSHAPGVGTPEPYGLSDWDVREIIHALSPRLVGADVVEVSPLAENHVTPVLAAKVVQEVISAVVSTDGEVP